VLFFFSARQEPVPLAAWRPPTAPSRKRRKGVQLQAGRSLRTIINLIAMTPEPVVMVEALHG
jgi:hypothetical protein